MSLFSWFSGKSNDSARAVSDSTSPQDGGKPGSAADRAATPADISTPSPDARLIDRKARRHARRDLLYTAIREGMTRAGVLSASYKFKVLSLDQRGDKFLVMMDMAPGTDGRAEKLTEIETQLISTVKRLFSMEVTSVYWRTEPRPLAATATQPEALEPVRTAPFTAVKNPAGQRFEPIKDDEVAALRQALVAPSEQTPPTPDATAKSKGGLRSFTLMTGFEDTEMPEPSAAPALSATQYGELR